MEFIIAVLAYESIIGPSPSGNWLLPFSGGGPHRADKSNL
jgi:hypothetical protein